MNENSNLVDFERGSTLGGILTAVVFIGFTYLLLSDLSYNISNKPYTFEVREKIMSPEEHMATKVNLGDYTKSQEFVLGFTVLHENGTRDNEFDPFDNDYIEVFTNYWDYEMSQKEGKDLLYVFEGPELEICSRERMIDLIGATAEYYRRNYICLKDKSQINLYSNWL